MPISEGQGQEILSRMKSIPQWIWASTLIVSLVIAIVNTVRVHRMLTSASWPTVPGTIATSDLKYDTLIRGILNYNLHIVYHYTVNGTRYEGKRVSFAGKTGYIGRTGDEKRVKRALQIYPQGAAVNVYHHPSDPGLAVLETGFSRREFKIVLLALGMVLLAFAGLWRRWSLQTDYLFRHPDPDAPMTWQKFILGAMGLATCIGIAWVWWELIKKYAGR